MRRRGVCSSLESVNPNFAMAVQSPCASGSKHRVDRPGSAEDSSTMWGVPLPDRRGQAYAGRVASSDEELAEEFAEQSGERARGREYDARRRAARAHERALAAVEAAERARSEERRVGREGR